MNSEDLWEAVLLPSRQIPDFLNCISKQIHNSRKRRFQGCSVSMSGSYDARWQEIYSIALCEGNDVRKTDIKKGLHVLRKASEHPADGRLYG